MPYIDAGSVVYPIEHLLDNPDSVAGVIASIGEECRCAIVDSPFVASVERGGLSVEYSVGVGSLVCSPGCGFTGGLKLLEPAWGRGRVLGGDLAPTCVTVGEYSGTELSVLGINVKPLGSLHEFFDAVTRQARRGIAVLPLASGELEVERVGSLCGRLHSRNPLHPAGVVGKPGVNACCEDVHVLVGSRGRMLNPVLALEDTTVISTIQGMGEGIVYGYDPLSAGSKHLRLAAVLGMLYTCGVEGERL